MACVTEGIKQFTSEVIVLYVCLSHKARGRVAENGKSDGSYLGPLERSGVRERTGLSVVTSTP